MLLLNWNPVSVLKVKRNSCFVLKFPVVSHQYRTREVNLSNSIEVDLKTNAQSLIDMFYMIMIFTSPLFFFIGLLERLKDGEYIVCAEGYMFEFEKRGYLSFGAHIPEVVLERPDLVRIMHEEFVHAGSDVVEAFTVRCNLS